MPKTADFDIIVYGATGFTGKLVAEYLSQSYGEGSVVNWAIAGRSENKLAAVKSELGIESTPHMVADASAPDTLKAMAESAKCVISTVGPYTLYGEPLVKACIDAGTDYVDLSGEPLWMKQMIDKHSEAAKASGARIVHSCGFDSIPFDLGVQLLQEEAVKQTGKPFDHVRGRMVELKATFSGGTAASAAATQAAIQKDPTLFNDIINPFLCAEGYIGPDQPRANKPVEEDGVWAAPFFMAVINTKTIHRSNALLDFAYGKDFKYDEMILTGTGEKGKAVADYVTANPMGEGEPPKPGEGPSKEERENGFFKYHAIGETFRVEVTGDKDPGYGSTSKMISEAALCLVQDCPDLTGGIYTTAPAMGAKLRKRLVQNAGLTFTVLA